MERFLIDSNISPKEELIALLDYNGFDYSAESPDIRFILEDGFYKWETVCCFTRTSVLIYGMYPFETDDCKSTLESINKVNNLLTRGSMILSEKRVIMRTSADLYDAYGAYETIARAIEYNAGAIVKFWQSLRLVNAKPGFDHISSSNTEKMERRALRIK